MNYEIWKMFGVGLIMNQISKELQLHEIDRAFPVVHVDHASSSFFSVLLKRRKNMQSKEAPMKHNDD